MCFCVNVMKYPSRFFTFLFDIHLSPQICQPNFIITLNGVEVLKSLPSLQGLFYICEFLGITPQQFFDDGNAYPAQLAALVEDLKKLDAKSLEHIAAIVKELVKDE